MNKEILEITKKFHDTYEKLASEYTYETREDTRVFDINSNNGKLMYATVNEIVSPILKDNKKLKQKYLNAVADYEMVMSELQELKKQLEDANEKILLLQASEPMLNYKKALEETQQKEFIEYLEDKIKSYKNRDSYMVTDILGSYDLNNIELELLEEILNKYKEIIGE